MAVTGMAWKDATHLSYEIMYYVIKLHKKIATGILG